MQVIIQKSEEKEQELTAPMAAAENQRIHPVDVEATQTAPLVPPGSSKSEKLDQIQTHHRSASPRKRSHCCRCVCCLLCFIIFLIIAVGLTAGILYLVFRPKIPKYSINSLSISDLRLNYDMTIYAKFDVKITAENPNEKIGIYYKDGGVLSVWYTKTKLCQGNLPEFYQGHKNRTVLNVSLTGQTESGNSLMNALQQQQQTGQIPLELKVYAPVAVKFGQLKLRKVKILGECSLVVDSLNANNLVSIKASNCRFKVKL